MRVKTLLASSVAPILVAFLCGCPTSVAPPSSGYAKVDFSQINGGPSCQDPGEFLRIGANYNSVVDESSADGATFGIECQVREGVGGKFSVIARAERRGTKGGSFTVEGALSAVTGKQSNVRGAFQNSTAFYSQSNCTVELLDTASITAGKVRGVVTCNDAIKSDVPGDVRCAARTEFQFEDCAK